jgi:hypothetical protein
VEKLEIERWLKIQLITNNFESLRLKSDAFLEVLQPYEIPSNLRTHGHPKILIRQRRVLCDVRKLFI